MNEQQLSSKQIVVCTCNDSERDELEAIKEVLAAIQILLNLLSCLTACRYQTNNIAKCMWKIQINHKAFVYS